MLEERLWQFINQQGEHVPSSNCQIVATNENELRPLEKSDASRALHVPGS